MTDILQDLRYGLRTMLKSPIFTLVAVLTIAVGIGANVIVFSLVERILLNSLPYPEPDRLVKLIQSYPEKGLDSWGLSPATFARYRDQNRSFDAVTAYLSTGMVMTGLDKPEYLQAASVTADFFKVFGVAPILGRTFTSEEDTPGKNNVAVLSNSFWERRFGGDPQVVGKSVVLNDVPVQIIGVMPASFRFPAPETELWSPMSLDPNAFHPFLLTGVARLKQGVGRSAAESDTTAILWNGANENPELVSRKSAPPQGAGLRTKISPLKESIVGKMEKPLLILQIAVAFVLLIACANVANLLLSRATRRTNEIALRLALGAAGRRVIRQLLTESLMLALFGAVAGTAFAWWCVGTLGRAYVQGIPRIEEAGISPTVLAVTVLLTVLTGILFGLAPAFRAHWLGVKVGLNEGQKGSPGHANRRMNSTLVAVQLALSLVLLIGAGLMLKSFSQLIAVDPGFRADNALTMIVPVSSKKYANPGQAAEFYKELLDEVRTQPGINSAAVASTVPFCGRNPSDGYIVEGKEPRGASDAPQAQIMVVSPGYFQAMGMSLEQGRDFQDSDRGDSQLVAIVDETLAKKYWPGGGAIGKRIRTLDPDWYTIVGVVSSVKDVSLTEESAPHLYLAFSQLGFAYGGGPSQRRMYLVANTSHAATTTSLVREKVRGLDPDVPVYAVSTIADLIGKKVESQELIRFLLTVFGAIALLLAAIGTYGVMSVFVSSRTAEFAIRQALGAPPEALLVSLLKQGLTLAGIGIVIGLLGSLVLTRAISSQLFEVNTADPIVYSVATSILILVALIASYLPARRAARTDPAVVLRNS